MANVGKLSARFAAQLAHPTGLAGRVLGHAMDRANRACVRLAVDLLDPQPGERVLDAGCGTGAALAEVSRRALCELAGVDLSPTMVAAARRGLGPGASLVAMPLADLPGKLAPFDGVLAINVLYFADHYGQMVGGLHRSLRPGGRLVAYVTHRDTMAGWPFVAAGLHRLYDVDALAALLVRGGFAPSAVSVEERRMPGNVRGLFARAVR